MRKRIRSWTYERFYVQGKRRCVILFKVSDIQRVESFHFFSNNWFISLILRYWKFMDQDDLGSDEVGIAVPIIWRTVLFSRKKKNFRRRFQINFFLEVSYRE